MPAQYPPGTLLTRDREEPYHFRGPDGEVYVGHVACTELDAEKGTFVPRVPRRRRRPWPQRLYLGALHRLGFLARIHNDDGSVDYTTRADASFIRHVYGDDGPRID